MADVDIVRVLRIIEYVGPRDAVEKNVSGSLHGNREGSRTANGCCIIRAATIGIYPEILEQASAQPTEPGHPEDSRG